MHDELDALLQRRFAESRQPLTDARFVAAVSARLPAYTLRRALAAALGAVVGAIGVGLTFGIIAPLRLRNAAVVAVAALGIAAWSIFGSSL
jgi:hypothetical protein